MPYADGQWGKKARKRSKRRKKYFLKRAWRSYRGVKQPASTHPRETGERLARRILGPQVRYVNKPGWDFLWGEHFTVEVKFSKYYLFERRWQFHITNSEQKKCDYFLLICSNRTVLLVPSWEITTKRSISVSLKRLEAWKQYAFRKGR